MDESLDYARTAVAAGTERIIATPHVELVDVRELPERVEELRDALGNEGIALELECGGEVKPYSVPALSHGALDTVAHGPPGRRWVLLEVPFRGLGDDLIAAADELRQRGFGVLLAHPERAADFADSTPLLREQVERGAAVQMNVGPLTGDESRARADAARRLLEIGMPTALATDAHPPDRPYTLKQGRDLAVASGAAEARAARLVDEGPRTLLAEGLSARR